MNRECENCLTCPRRIGRDILAVAGLPDDLWACEALVDDGVTIYHVARLSEILAMNDIQLGRGWSAGFAIFALCRTVDEAHVACERMRAKQRALRLLGVPAVNDFQRRKQPARHRDRKRNTRHELSSLKEK